MAVETDLEEVGAKASNGKKAAQARQRALNNWLQIENKFRDPMAGQVKETEAVKDAAPKADVTSEMNGEVVL